MDAMLWRTPYDLCGGKSNLWVHNPLISFNHLVFNNMTRLFLNVWPQGNKTKASDFTKEYVDKLLKLTDVETTIAFDDNDSMSLIVLDAADNLLESFQMHNIDARVGIVYDYSRNYPDWMLIVETENIRGSINPLVARFFNWEKIETQSILTFNELMEN